MSDLSTVVHDNSKKLEEIMLELNILKTDRILFIGSKNLALCLHLCGQGYEKLYLIDNNRNVYNNPCYTEVRYFYQKDFKLHFPFHFFKVILVSNPDFDENLYNYTQGSGAIIVSNFTINGKLSAENVPPNALSQITSRIPNFSKANGSLENSSLHVFKAGNTETENLPPKGLDIICYSGREEGIYVHSKILKERLETEYGMTVNLTDTVNSVQSSFVVVEYHPGYRHFEKLLEDITLLVNRNTKVILENHGSLRKISDPLKRLIDRGLIVTYRSPEIAEQDHIEQYSILPVLTYKNINIEKSVKTDELRLGTFGFIGKQKGNEDIISLAFKLKVHATLLLGVNPTDPGAEKKILDFEKKYGKRRNISIRVYDRQISYYDNVLVDVFIGNHTDKDIINTMSRCSHIVFAHRTRMEESGTIKYAKRLLKPIFALDSFQSRIGQVYRFSKFTNLTPFRLIMENVVEVGLAVVRGDLKLSTSIQQISRSIVIQLKALFRHDSPNRKSLVKMSRSNIRDDDGLDYMMAILRYTRSS